MFAREPLKYFFMSPPAACPYVPGRRERLVFTDLISDDPDSLHHRLAQAGFRRSQNIAYKPACPGCNACVPVRVPADRFRLTGSHKRVLRRNDDVTARWMPVSATREHYALFRRYVVGRHADGGMAGMGFAEYRAMVEESPVDTGLVEFRGRDDSLYGVCLTDRLSDGLSLVYSFYDVDRADDSPGGFIILWHLAEARRSSLPYVYLGYWIGDSRKMAYKTRYRPIEALGDKGWEPLFE